MDLKVLQSEQAKLAELQIKKTRLSRDADIAVAEWQEQRMKVRDMMEESGLRTMNGNSGLGFQAPEPTWFATIQDFNAWTRWAQENNPSLLRLDKRVTKQMNELIRERQEDNQPLPPGLGSYPKRVVRITGLPKDAAEPETTFEDEDLD